MTRNTKLDDRQHWAVGETSLKMELLIDCGWGSGGIQTCSFNANKPQRCPEKQSGLPDPQRGSKQLNPHSFLSILCVSGK